MKLKISTKSIRIADSRSNVRKKLILKLQCVPCNDRQGLMGKCMRYTPDIKHILVIVCYSVHVDILPELRGLCCAADLLLFTAL